jgi:AcrR family transcriptional regulator
MHIKHYIRQNAAVNNLTYFETHGYYLGMTNENEKLNILGDGEKIKKRDAIIQSAFKLFYSAGVDETSFEAIANDCGVTAPLITYHFKTKNKLVEEIANKLTGRIAKATLDKLYANGIKYEPKLNFAVNIILIHMLFDEDEKARKFFLYFLNCGFEYTFIDGHKNYYATLDRFYCFNLDPSKDEISLLSTSLLFSAFSLTYAFFTGRLGCTLEQMTDYMIASQFKQMNIPADEISTIISQAKNLVRRLDFKIGAFFEIG